MEINNVLELKKYKESKEFQRLVQKYKNKAEKIREEVLIDLKSGKCSKDMVAGEDDKLILIAQVLEELIGDIKETTIGAELLKKNLTSNIENIEFNLVRQYKGWADPIYTRKCIKLITAGEYDFLEGRIDGLIALEDKKEEKIETDVYD